MFQVAIDLIFVADVVLNFRTGYALALFLALRPHRLMWLSVFNAPTLRPLHVRFSTPFDLLRCLLASYMDKNDELVCSKM